ncbi:MAG: PQQ-binding-like beta-propeller repeat protein [Akkermansiaceae bacterium]|nr:PQQ-binding-like beta-propeller repeat protein [Akkermansiaceae bacterium]
MGADWPQWCGNDARNAVSVETPLPAQFTPNPSLSDAAQVATGAAGPTHLKWKVRLSSHAYGGPVVANGKIFIGTNTREGGGAVIGLEEATGRALWKLTIPRLVTEWKDFNYDDMSLGICSTPTVAEQRLYVVSNRDEMLCLDLAGRLHGAEPDVTRLIAGSEQPPMTLDSKTVGIAWRFDMLTEKDVAAWPQDAADCSVLVHGDHVFVSPSNGVNRGHEIVPHPDAPSLFVLDKRTGRLLARDFEQVGHRLFHGEWSSPALGEVNGRTLVFYGGGDGVCYAFDPVPAPSATPGGPGVLKCVWHFDVNAAAGRQGVYKGNATGPSEIIATPVFHRNRGYVGVGQDPRHGRGRGALACIDATGVGDLTAKGLVWVNTDIDRSLTTVAIKDDILSTADFSGRIFALAASTGHELWRYETDRPIWSSPLVADGKAYVGTDTGELWTFAASRELKILGKTKLDSPISTSPIVANGVLYVMTQRWLYAAASGADNH